MSTFETMLNMQLSLFAIMMLGFFCRKKGMIDTKHAQCCPICSSISFCRAIS